MGLLYLRFTVDVLAVAHEEAMPNSGIELSKLLGCVDSGKILVPVDVLL